MTFIAPNHKLGKMSCLALVYNASWLTRSRSVVQVRPFPSILPAASVPLPLLNRLRWAPISYSTAGSGDMSPVQKSEEEWRAVLSPEQFRILRQKGTEYPGTGEYNKLFDDGVYKCAGCDAALYKSTTKFNSGCGWPAFFEGLPGAITRTEDADGRRIEITCTACGGHLGHVFKGEGFPTPTDERHCVNSVSLKFTSSSSSS